MNLVQLIIGLALIIFGLFFFFMIYANVNNLNWYFRHIVRDNYGGAAAAGFFGIIIGFIVIFWK